VCIGAAFSTEQAAIPLRGLLAVWTRRGPSTDGKVLGRGTGPAFDEQNLMNVLVSAKIAFARIWVAENLNADALKPAGPRRRAL